MTTDRDSRNDPLYAGILVTISDRVGIWTIDDIADGLVHAKSIGRDEDEWEIRTCGEVTRVTSDRDEALSVLSDVYKDVYGYRPRGVYAVDSMTTDEIWEEVQRLSDENAAAMAREEEWEAECAAKEAAAMDATPLTYNPFAGLRLS